MGQVVDISIDGQPKELKKEPNEERAYDEHVRQQRQLDQQRVSHGLDPVAAEAPSVDSDPIAAEDLAVLTDEDDGPQSIYTEKFAGLGLADFMQSILNENKAERDAERRTKNQTQSMINGAACTQGGPPQNNHQTHSEIGVYTPAQCPGHAPYKPSQDADGITRRTCDLNNGLDVAPSNKPSFASHSIDSSSRPDLEQTFRGDNGKTGLSQSRWNTVPSNSGQGATSAAEDGAKALENTKQPLPSGSDWW